MTAAGSRRRLLAGLLTCVVAIAFESIAVLTAMPAAAADLGQLDLYAWAFTAFVIGQTFSIVAGGQLSDRIGPVPPLLGGLVVFAFGLAVAGLAPTMLVLLTARLIQGLGAGTLNVAIMVLTARVYDERERAQVMTWYSACWMLPAFAGPPLAAWITSVLSWHWVFWSVLPVMAAACGLTWGPLRRLRLPTAPGEALPTRHLGIAALVAGAAAALQLSGQRIEPWSALWAGLALAALAAGVPVLMPADFSWRGRGLSAVVVVRALAAGAFFGAEAFLTLMLIEAHDLSLVLAGLTLTIGSVGWMGGAWLQSRPWFRLRRDAIVLAGAVAVTIGIALVAVAGAWAATGLAIVVIGWVIAGLGMGLQSASTSLAVMQLSGPGDLGRNSSALQVGEALGSSVCAGLAGTWFALTHSGGDNARTFGGLFALMVAAGAVSTLAASRIGPVRNHSITR